MVEKRKEVLSGVRISLMAEERLRDRKVENRDRNKW